MAVGTLTVGSRALPLLFFPYPPPPPPAHLQAAPRALALTASLLCRLLGTLKSADSRKEEEKEAGPVGLSGRGYAASLRR